MEKEKQMTKLHLKIYHPKTGKWDQYVLQAPIQIPVMKTIEEGSIICVEVLSEDKRGRRKK